MLTARVLSQYLVLSSKTIRPNVPRSARCVGHCEMTWPAVCLVAPLLLFENEARSRSCIYEQICRRLNLTQEARSKPIPKGVKQTLETKSWNADELLEFSMLRFLFARMFISFPRTSTHGLLDFSRSLLTSYDQCN